MIGLSLLSLQAVVPNDGPSRSTDKSAGHRQSLTTPVYVGCGDGTLCALAASDGTEKWGIKTGKQVSPAPAVVDDTVYIGGVGDGEGLLYALDATDGTKRWSFGMRDAVGSLPAVTNDAVYIGGNDGTVYATGYEQRNRTVALRGK